MKIFKVDKHFRDGDLKSFIEIIESEAFNAAWNDDDKHALFHSNENLPEINNKIWNFRQETGLHICFNFRRWCKRSYFVS
jgi:diphosphomevalonate decarboxylase